MYCNNDGLTDATTVSYPTTAATGTDFLEQFVVNIFDRDVDEEGEVTVNLDPWDAVKYAGFLTMMGHRPYRISDSDEAYIKSTNRPRWLYTFGQGCDTNTLRDIFTTCLEGRYLKLADMCRGIDPEWALNASFEDFHNPFRSMKA